LSDAERVFVSTLTSPSTARVLMVSKPLVIRFVRICFSSFALALTRISHEHCVDLQAQLFLLKVLFFLKYKQIDTVLIKNPG
jgi:hypothetical protein